MKVSHEKVDNAISWHEQNGKSYLVLEYKALNDLETLEVIMKTSEMVKKKGLNSTRVISDLSESHFSYNIHATLRKFSKEHQKFVLKAAIIGLSPRLMPFYKVYKSVTKTKAKVFKTKEDAISFICS